MKLIKDTAELFVVTIIIKGIIVHWMVIHTEKLMKWALSDREKAILKHWHKHAWRKGHELYSPVLCQQEDCIIV